MLSHGLVEMRLMPAHCGHGRYSNLRRSGQNFVIKRRYRPGMRMSRLGQLITRCQSERGGE